MKITYRYHIGYFTSQVVTTQNYTQKQVSIAYHDHRRVIATKCSTTECDYPKMAGCLFRGELVGARNGRCQCGTVSGGGTRRDSLEFGGSLQEYARKWGPSPLSPPLGAALGPVGLRPVSAAPGAETAKYRCPTSLPASRRARSRHQLYLQANNLSSSQ